MNALASRIRTRREALHISQDTLARLVCVTRQSVSLWERGRTAPNARQLTALCKALNVTPSELLTMD